MGAPEVRPTETEGTAATTQIRDVIAGIIENDDIGSARRVVVELTTLASAEREATRTTVGEVDARRVDIVVPPADSTTDLGKSPSGNRGITA